MRRTASSVLASASRMRSALNANRSTKVATVSKRAISTSAADEKQNLETPLSPRKRRVSSIAKYLKTKFSTSVAVAEEADDFNFDLSAKMQEVDSSAQFAVDTSTTLGVGGFASVHPGVDLSTGDSCAVKISHPDIREDVKQRELEALLAVVGIDNVVQVKAAHESCGNLHIVLPLFEDGDLLDHIIDNGTLKSESAKVVMGKVLHALNNMHERGLVHLDLKPENIFVEAGSCGNIENVVLGDLGHTRRHHGSVGELPGQQVSPDESSFDYCAPEILDNKYHSKSDVYSAGMVMHAAICGHLPAAPSPEDGYKISLSSSLDGPAISLLNKMLHPDVEQRITASEALQHEWFDV